MAVFIFHSYLLRGTGSNVYNAELAQELARQGREVHIFCQDPEADDLPWVNEVGRVRDGRLDLDRVRPALEVGGPPCRGRITAWIPEIGGLLPVFVEDRYRGYRVKTFPDLTDGELDDYLAANVGAVRAVAEEFGPFEAALANHLIMAPVILARAGLQYAIKVHGSDLSYAVGPYPERFVPYAQEGLRAAAGVLVGSSHTARQLLDTVAMDDLPAKTRLGPPGLDSARFRPRDRADAVGLVERVAVEAASLGGSREFGRDPARASEGMTWFAAGKGPRAVFIGKLLINKGVDLLAAAWPLIHAGSPDARLLIGGFGGFTEGLEQLLEALAAGDLEAATALAASAVEGNERLRQLPILRRFLQDPPAGYREACRGAAGSVRVTGRLEHREVAAAVGAADLFFMPSTFPEAFGMVAAEAAAAGTFPIAARHSGIAEVLGRLAEAIGPKWGPLLGFDLTEQPVQTMAANGSHWLATPAHERKRVEAELSAAAAARWGWGRTAGDVIAAANGDLERLARPEYTFRALQ